MASEAVKLEDLKPYKSILIASIEPAEDGAGPASPVPSILHAYEKALTGDDAVTILHHLSSTKMDDGSVVGFLVYSEQRRPAWLAEGSESEIMDLENHLLLICLHRQHVAALLTDKRRKRTLESSIRRLDGLALVPPNKVRNAFVRGPALALWMAGIHPSVTIKPDSKTLHGQNLRDAIDPLGDQTYMVTAARSRVSDLGLAVGSSLHGSRIWIGPSRDWSDCIDTLFSVLDYLAEDPPEDPLPFVPRTVDAGYDIDLRKAYEILLLPPELMGDVDELADEDKRVMERWAYSSRIDVKSGHQGHLIVAVHLAGRWLADLRLGFDFEDPASVKVEAKIVAEADRADKLLLEELEGVLERSRWLHVWFHTGETLVDGQLCIQQYLELPFDGYQWEDFSDVDVKTEKFWAGRFPDDPIAAIDAGRSLFSWVKSNWPATNRLAGSGGWLACDDGSMEIADFVHLDTNAKPPVLSLIHVEAARSRAADRGLSVASYQIVVSQALRNLRYFHRETASESFLAGLEKEISSLVWYDGEPSDRASMARALEEVAGNYRRQVVVIQPQVTRRRLEATRKNPKHRDHPALRQLDTLFLATAESCRQLQASFTVVADGL